MKSLAPFPFCLSCLLVLASPPGYAQNKVDESLKKDEVFRATGQLTKEDLKDRLRKECHFKVFLLRMLPGRTYTIDMQSRDFDSYLRLEGSAGDPLAEDDDSGGGLHARLVFRPPQDDVYRVVVTTFAPGATGHYLLTIRQEEAAKPKPE